MKYHRVKIKGFEDYEVDTEGNVFNKKGNKLKPVPRGQGKYSSVNLKLRPYNYPARYIHRLVAQAFIPNPENKYSVNHIDGNRLNNNVENLEWATGTEQNNHAFATGLKLPGEGVGNSKLKNHEVLAIRKDTKSKLRILAKKYGVCKATISMIRNRIMWKHL